MAEGKESKGTDHCDVVDAIAVTKKPKKITMSPIY